MYSHVSNTQIKPSVKYTAKPSYAAKHTQVLHGIWKCHPESVEFTAYTVQYQLLKKIKLHRWIWIETALVLL